MDSKHGATVYNMLMDSKHGATAKDLKAAITASSSDLHQSLMTVRIILKIMHYHVFVGV